MMGVLNLPMPAFTWSAPISLRAAADRLLGGADHRAAGCGAIGAAIEIYGLRRTHHNGHIAELLFTFGLFFIIERGVQMAWGMLPVPYRVPAGLDFPLFTLTASISRLTAPLCCRFRRACWSRSGCC